MNDALGQPQSALVLGGTSEIAFAILARLVAGRCGKVVLAGRDPSAMAGVAERLDALGAKETETVPFDAADIDGHAHFAAETFERFGDFDLVLVAAGVLGDQEAEEADPVAAARVITVNFTGLASAMLAITDRLRRQGHGRLVVLSSVAAERPRRANFIYGSSKAGLDAFSQGLGDSLAGTGVSLLIVRPGFVHTKMTAGREAAPFATTPEAVADVVVRALGTRAEVVYAPPILRWVFLVLKNLPRALWRKVPG